MILGLPGISNLLNHVAQRVQALNLEQVEFLDPFDASQAFGAEVLSMSSLPVQNIFESLREADLSLSLTTNSGISMTPASRLTDDLRTLIRDN